MALRDIFNEAAVNSAWVQKIHKEVTLEENFMGHLTLKVFPASKKQKIEIHAYGENTSQRSKFLANGPDLTVRLCEKAQDNKANAALIKILKKLTHKTVQIKAGMASRLKVIEFEGKKEDFLKKLQISLHSQK